MIARLLGAALAAALWLMSPPGLAQPSVPTSLRMVLADCSPIVSRRDLLGHLRVELLSIGVQELEIVHPEAQHVTEGDGPRAATLHVYFPECDDESGVVHLRVSDRLTLKYVERALYVGDVNAEARPRTVALAIAELLRATWLELVLTKNADDQPSDALRHRLILSLKEASPDAPVVSSSVHAPPEADAADVHAERWYKPRLEWIAGSRIYAQGASGDLSTSISASLALNRRLRAHVGGLAAGGGTNESRAVHLFEAAGRVGLGLSGGQEIEIEVASVFEVGWAQLRGQRIPDVSGAMVVGALHASLRTAVTRGTDVIFGLQGGYVLTPLVIAPDSANDGSNALDGERGMTGPIVGILLGLSGIL